jgi:hypothetical protein
MSEDLNFAGQYAIDNIEWIQPNGAAFDIREHYTQIILYEDMFAPFMSGNIIMNDTIDLPNIYLNTGVDLIRLRLRTPGFPASSVIDKYFHIYKIDERDTPTDRALSYIIHIVSKENIMDQATKISKTFKGSATEIARTITKTYLQTELPMITDDTNNIIQYTSNFWSPTKNLVYVSERAVGAGGLPSFLFYENRYGFNLRELTDFAKADTPLMQSWHANNYTADVSAGGSVIREPQKDYETVSDVDMKVNFDHMKDAGSGLIKTRLFSYDLITRTFSDRQASIIDSELPLLNKQRMYNDAVTQSAGPTLMTGFSHFNSYNGAGSNSSAVNNVHKRNVIMRAFQQHKVEITVFGRMDYTVGMKAWFDGNKMRPFDRTVTNPDEIIDNVISGYFIVSAVRHLFTRDNHHECKIELMKDSVLKP